MGMGRFGSGWGWTRGFPPAPARGVLYFRLLPLTGAYIQRWCGSGGAAAGGSEALAVPTLGMERAAACGPGSTGKHAVLGLRCREGGGREGSSHFTLFREY